jgi:TolB-like protein/DNA-binding winged helix-turn-helix (wHTH) protein
MLGHHCTRRIVMREMMAHRAASACDPGHDRLINLPLRSATVVRRVHVAEFIGEASEAESIEPCAIRVRYGAVLKSSKSRAILGKKRALVADSGVSMADRDDIFLFAGFRLDRRAGSLFQCGEDGVLSPVPIGPRALDVLGVLVERAGDLVSRDEIIAAAWPETVVNDNNLNMQIAAIRRVLDDGEAMPSCIQTIPRRGYRFVAAVTRAGPPTQLIPIQPLHSRDQDYAPRPVLKSRSRYRARRAIMAGVVGALVLAAAVAAAWYTEPLWFAGARPVPRLSIVVLPFANLGDDPGQRYFADAITEDLTTDLSRLADMLVISRDTAFTYKDKPVNAKWIGHELGVRYVLEGSVQRSGNRARINVQLIDAETDTHLWAERFDRDVGDLFVVQNEITGRIGAALSLTLTASEAARPTEHPDALDHIFRGRTGIYKPASRQNFAEAIAEFEQALALNPHSIEAQSRLAIALASRALDDMSVTAKADIERGNRLVEQSLATSPDSPLAHFAKAQLLRAQHRCGAAIPEYEIVLAANRSELSSIGNIGRCKIYLGAIDDGVALEEQAIRLSPPRDPFVAVWYFRIGQARLLQSRIDEAIRWLEKAHDANPAYPFVATWLAAAYGLQGDLPHAAAELAEARRLSGSGLPASIAAERTGSAKDFTAPATRALLETTYLTGLRQAGVPEK